MTLYKVVRRGLGGGFETSHVDLLEWDDINKYPTIKSTVLYTLALTFQGNYVMVEEGDEATGVSHIIARCVLPDSMSLYPNPHGPILNLIRKDFNDHPTFEEVLSILEKAYML